MKAALLVVVLALGYVPRAYAADDAPLIEEATGLKCYTPEQRANIAAALESERARVKSLQDDAGKPPVLLLVLVGVLGVVVGGAATFAVVKATEPRP